MIHKTDLTKALSPLVNKMPLIQIASKVLQNAQMLPATLNELALIITALLPLIDSLSVRLPLFKLTFIEISIG